MDEVKSDKVDEMHGGYNNNNNNNNMRKRMNLYNKMEYDTEPEAFITASKYRNKSRCKIMNEEIREAIIYGIRGAIGYQLLFVEELIVNYTFTLFLYVNNIYIQHKEKTFVLKIIRNFFYYTKMEVINDEFLHRLILGIKLPSTITNNDIENVKTNPFKYNEFKSNIINIKNNDGTITKLYKKSINEMFLNGFGLNKNKPINLSISTDIEKYIINDLIICLSNGYKLIKCSDHSKYLKKHKNKKKQQIIEMNKYPIIQKMNDNHIDDIEHDDDDDDDDEDDDDNFISNNMYNDILETEFFCLNRCNKYDKLIEKHFGFIKMIKVLRISGYSLYKDKYYAMTFLHPSHLRYFIHRFESKKCWWSIHGE